MKKFFLCFSIFFSVFSIGISAVLLLKINKASVSSPRSVFSFPAEAAGKQTEKKSSSAPSFMRPLRLPLGAAAETCSEKSWEFSGEIEGNMVSARGRLVSSICNQGWFPDKKIPLDENLAPREILTFNKEKYELVLMLWKISVNTTGFAYRRDLQDKPIGKVTQ